MNILSVESLCKSHGTKVLFENITFGVDSSEKIGLIGINGTGKSTLLKIIAGLDVSDSGTVSLGSGLQIEYLPQDPVFQNGATVMEQVFRGTSPIMQLLREYEYALERLQENPSNEDLQKRLVMLSQRMDSQGAWQLESEARAVLTRLGISDFSARVDHLSGGMRKRIALASSLITPADLLILDEPTNHIDSDTVDWLEQYLNQRKGALLLITHDRYFLDRVVNKIFELDRGRLYAYTGNYSVFVNSKLLRLEQEQSTENKRQNLLRNELAWMRRGAKARTTKQKARIDRYHELEEQKPVVVSDKIELSVGSTRLGKKVIELNNICKQFSGITLLDNFSYIVSRQDRIGIIGSNGCGKSTLLNILAGKIAPDRGSIDIGETVKIGYFSQESGEMNETLRVIEYIKEEAEIMTTADGGVITASQLLERFLFSPHLQWTPISKLSGGEKRRLYLLRVLMSAPNVILLDEPTNDLDIQTLTILEEYLDEFPGAVITVSHDRYFLDRTTERIFVFKDNGEINQYLGNYSDYLEIVKGEQATQSAVKKSNTSQQSLSSTIASTRDSDKSEGKKNQPIKFSFKEQREFEQIESIIASTEDELEELKDKIHQAGSNYTLLQELVKVQLELDTKLENLIDRWAQLNEIAAEINKNKLNH
ncbi:MAG TPA: ABC-F family ATP-binding cassette domain-containing protein [Candidatus Deferrimicrobium sp.]|nr:ABC-F family ATP-binding cassette domain-containing protein [Candidatus Deferrimicrobium sp.]